MPEKKKSRLHPWSQSSGLKGRYGGG